MATNFSKRGLGLALIAPAIAIANAKERPNIIFFIVDDMGWVDSSVAYGSETYPNNLRYHTPNMQRLASEGVILTNAYACPVSTPTRTSILTGQNAAHTRITNWTSAMRDMPSDAAGGAITSVTGVADVKGELQRPDWNINGMSPIDGVENTCYATPFPKILQENGYFTIHVGKAHWAAAGTPGASPYNMGYLVNITGNVAGMPRSYLSEDNYGNKPDKWTYMAVQNMAEYYGTGLHLTEALTREALKTLDYPIRNGQPFFLQLAHYATHTPIQPDERFIEKYRKAGLDEGQARYASMVEGVDKSLGDVMEYLEKHNIEKQTIIIFMTDNGGNAENKAKGGIRHKLNLPLREGKGSCYEGGIRVPFAVKWHNKIAANTRINTPIICEDLFPTILEMAEIRNYSTVQEIDGKSIVPLITKGSKIVAKAKSAGKINSQKEANDYRIDESVSGIDPDRELIFHYPHQWKGYDLPNIDYLSAIRKGDWKLVYRLKEGKVELYNIAEDIGEEHDVASQNPQMVKELSAILSNRLREWNSPMPIRSKDGKKVAMPDEL